MLEFCESYEAKCACPIFWDTVYIWRPLTRYYICIVMGTKYTDKCVMSQSTGVIEFIDLLRGGKKLWCMITRFDCSSCIDCHDGRKTIDEVLRALGHSIRLNRWLRYPVIDDRSVVSLTVCYHCNIDTDSVVFSAIGMMLLLVKTFVHVHILA